MTQPQTQSPEQIEWLVEKHVPELVNDVMYALLAAKPADIALHLAKWAADRLNTAQRQELLAYLGLKVDDGRRHHTNGHPHSPHSHSPTHAVARSPIIRQAKSTSALVDLAQAGLTVRGRSRSFSLTDLFNKLPDYEQTMLELYYANSVRPTLWQNLERYLRSGDEVALDTLELLQTYETFFSYPGRKTMAQLDELLGNFGNPHARAEACDAVVQVVDTLNRPPRLRTSIHFDVLVVEGEDTHEDTWLHEMERTRPSDPALQYGVVVVRTFAEALVALLLNASIQTVVVVDEVIPTTEFDGHFTDTLCAYEHLVLRPLQKAQGCKPHEVITHLISAIRAIRAEVDIFCVSDRPVYNSDLSQYIRRIFSARDDFYSELTASLMNYLSKRRATPFFTALTRYAARPIGVFHAMAISRGACLLKSGWCAEFLQFYGMNIFRAESSATCGGLDSLLDPTGSLKLAQEKAADAFGALSVFFVTNGTSTANKIVLQALLGPGDICIMDRDCHKSHHYGVIMCGALPAFLDAYPLHEYAMYGAVPLREIKRKLLEYRRAGLLDKVKLLVLTNCTFDGIVYNVQAVMEQCLAIKPDLMFLWDEAWFAYAGFHPVLKTRTAMGAADKLAHLFQSATYRNECQAFWARHGALLDSNDPADHEALLDLRLYPKPKEALLRVYATQSTHKSLTSFRQGSMIMVHDQLFLGLTKHNFNEAYYAHTSTSPNYQILASLDVGRSQMQLEGFEFVMDMLAHAMYLRYHVGSCKHLTKWIKFLDTEELIPAEYRQAWGKNLFNTAVGQLNRFEAAWLSDDEFVLDPTRLTLYTGLTGVNGNDFKVEWLMNKCDIQVNKTSRNSVLFQTNIGTSFSSATFLLQSLRKIVHDFNKQYRDSGGHHSPAMQAQVALLTSVSVPLPDFTAFHDAFRPKGTPGNEGSSRDAFYLAFDEANCEYVSLTDAGRRLAAGEQLTGTTFIIPYPPGFPIITPGQLISQGIIDFMLKLDVKEVHGYHAAQGLRIFK
eukprot:EG_transcript_1917